MTRRVRMPGDLLNVKTRFFARFTVKDLLRLGLPILLAAVLTTGSLLTQLPGLIFAAVLGVTWYGWRPYGYTFESHATHLFQWLYRKRNPVDRDYRVENGSVVVGDGHVQIGLVEVEPTNFGMKSEQEQAALHEVYRRLLSTVTYPVEIHSQQEITSLDRYLTGVQERDTLRKLRSSYVNYCRELSDGEIVSTQHLVVIRVERDGLNWLYQLLGNQIDYFDQKQSEESLSTELASRCQEVINELTTAELSAQRITGNNLEKQVKKEDTGTPFHGTQFYRRSENTDYRKTVYTTEFPSSMELGWPLQFLHLDGTIDIVQTIEPRNNGKTAKKLQRVTEKLNAEIDSLLRQGYSRTNRLEKLLEDAEWFQNLLADREDQPVNYTAYITAHAQNRKKTQETFEQVENRLETLQLDYQNTVLRTTEALHTDSILGHNQLNEQQLQPARSAAAGFPFGTQNADKNNGVVYGVDTQSQTPVLLDRFQWRSHSMARMGATGSGKSYAVKTEILRSKLAYPDLQIIVVDPKQEYKRLIRRLDGTLHTLEHEENYEFDNDVIGFEIPERGHRDNQELLVDAVRQIYTATSQDSQPTLVIIDEARILMNNETGREVLNQFVLEARDTRTAVTLISQNASHFTEYREGREILDNMPGKVFMRHERVPDSVTDYFQLSQREEQELYELKTGNTADYSEALVKVSGRVDTRIRIESTGEEHATITAGENQ